MAVVDKGEKTNPEAEKVMNVILKEARPEILKIYPSALCEGESVEGLSVAENQKVFGEPLTPALLQKHQKLTEEMRGN